MTPHAIRLLQVLVILASLLGRGFAEPDSTDCRIHVLKDWQTAFPKCENKIANLENEGIERNLIELTELYALSGFLLQMNGQILGARVYYNRALRLMDSTHRPNAYAKAAMLDRLGDIERIMGNYGAAIEIYESALRSLRNLPASRDTFSVYHLDGESGFFPAYLGSLQADPLYGNQFSMVRIYGVSCAEMIVGYHMALSVAPADRKGKIAGLYKGLTDLNRRCSSVLDKNIIIESFRQFTNALFPLLRPDERIEIYTEYILWLTMQSKSSTGLPALIASRLSGLGMLAAIHESDGKIDSVRQVLAQAAELSAGHADVIGDMLSNVHARWGLLELTRGTLQAAIPHYKIMAKNGYFKNTESEELPISPSGQFVQSIPHMAAQLFYAEIVRHPTVQEAWPVALDILLQEKGNMLEGERRVQRRLILPSVAGISETERQRRRVSSEINDLLLSIKRTRTKQEYQVALELLRSKQKSLNASAVPVFMRLSTRKAVGNSDVSPGKIAAALPAGSILVEVVYVNDPGHYLAFLLALDGAVQTVDLGKADAINTLIEKFLYEVSHASPDFEKSAQHAYQQIFAPLEPWLAEVSQVYLSLDGALSLMPFSAMHDGENYLQERFVFHYLNSGRDLARPLPPPSAAPAVLLANPLYRAADPGQAVPSSRDDARAGSSSCPMREMARDLRPLPGAEAEVDEIAVLLSQSQRFKGAQATEAALRAAVAPRILHIATHAEFLGAQRDVGGASSQESRSALRKLDASPLWGSSSARGGGGGCAPMFDSALLLAGAGQPENGALGLSADQDGILTADEVRNTMNLWGTELVVLSACKSGVGGVRLGEGVYGLRRAFFLAGAQSMVASLWSVDDAATRALMVSFYRHILSGKPRGTALHLAMTETRARKAHPYYWAPFIMIGRNEPLASVDKGRSAGPSTQAPEGARQGQGPAQFHAQPVGVAP